MRLAGTVKQYSKNAMPQLISIAFQSVMEVSFKCQYQANVIKIFDTISKAIVFIVAIISGKSIAGVVIKNWN